MIRQIKAAAQEGGETKVSIGRSERAEFVNRTGEITLINGPPSVQQGLNVLEATSSRTRIIMTRDNTLRTEGPSRTVIRQRGDDNNFPGGNRDKPPRANASPTPRGNKPARGGGRQPARTPGQ